jgi:hypothetical protein
MEVSDQLPAPAALFLGKERDAHWLEGWVGPRAGLDAGVKTKKFLPCPCRESNSTPAPTTLAELCSLQCPVMSYSELLQIFS